MTEHTPTPWTIGERDRLIVREVSGMCDGGDYYTVAETKFHSLVLTEEAAANAAFIVKAVNNHEALLTFFKWAMREGPWDGGDLDGGSVQDKAESLGLIVKTQYDAERHGIQSDFEHGDDWFEYKPDLRAAVAGASK